MTRPTPPPRPPPAGHPHVAGAGHRRVRWGAPPAIPARLEPLLRRLFRPLLARAEQAAIVASSDDAIIGCDREGRITSWNPAAERMFGYEAAEAVGRPVSRLMLPERTEMGREVLERVFAGERVGPYDTQGLRRNGSTVDVAVVVSPLRRGGRVVGAVTGVRDLSGKRAAEAALRQGEERFRSVVETARSAFVGMDETGRITDWNRRAEELFGWPREEVVGRLLEETIIPPEQRAAHREGLRRFLTTGEGPVIGQTIEVTAVCRTGDVLPVELSVWHLAEQDSHIFNAFVQDISERKQAEELQSRVAAIVESSAEAIVGFDTDLVITHWNTGAERLSGYTAAEAVGRPVGFLLPDGPDTGPTPLDEAVGGQRISDLETVVRTADGRVVPISLSASPIRNPAGTIIGVSAVAHDITERQDIRAALAAARDDALEASRLKSQFLATMSHEIRTPMNGVIGLTGLLLDTELAALQRRYAEGIRNAGEALLAVINDILDFSKIEAGHLELETVDFDLTPLVEDVAALVADGAREKGLEILVFCAPDLPPRVQGDANRIRQVLLNLVGNAVKFTPAGEVVVRVELESGGPAGAPLVRFEVTDTGIGIPAGRRAGLFQPFSQADASTTRRFGGTGLGLAISAQLVAAMGGSIDCDSEEGRGSRFWFTLPLRPCPERAPLLAGSNLLRGVPVLVADDNDTNRLILHTQLHAWGLRPDEVASGPEALDRLAGAMAAGRPYRLLIVDHQMPGMDGLDVARRVVADPATAGIPVLLLTSGGDVGPAAAEEAGLAGHLIKPVRQSDLYNFLLRAVAGVERRSDVASVPAAPEAECCRGTVLVAEDNEVNQMVALGILAKLGYQADIAGNGAEAVEAIRGGGQYDAVLMDCHMPEVDGYDATAAIREGEADTRSRLPIIAMTAGVLVEDRERALAAGMDDYVAKPIEVEALESVLDRWVPDRRPGARSRPAPEPNEPAERAGAGEAAVLDQERLAMLRRLGPADEGGLLPRLAGSFLAEAPALAEAIRDHFAAADAAALRQAAHRLRGAAANIGAHLLAGVCAELEAAADLEGTETLLDALDRELERSSLALAELTAS